MSAIRCASFDSSGAAALTPPGPRIQIKNRNISVRKSLTRVNVSYYADAKPRPATMNTPANTPSPSRNSLNSDVEIKGTLRFSGELTFDGKLDGEIHSEGNLHLVDNAVVKGNIHVSSVVLRGKINGNIIANERIDIKSKTELFGDIRSPKLVIE